MVFRLGDDDAINQYAGNFHMPRIERTRGCDPFYLGDYEAPAILGRCCECKVIEGQGLLFHRDVATSVGSCPADDCDINRKSLVEKPLLAVDLQQSHQLFGGPFIEFPTTVAGIDKGPQTYF